MEKKLTRGIAVALWIIAANLTFLSLSSLVGPAYADQRTAGDTIAQAVRCDGRSPDGSPYCWIRAETIVVRRFSE